MSQSEACFLTVKQLIGQQLYCLIRGCHSKRSYISRPRRLLTLGCHWWAGLATSVWVSYPALASCVGWLPMWAGFLCGLASCVGWLPVWAGYLCGLTSCVDWLPVGASFLCGVATYVGWLHVWPGFFSELASYVGWLPVWAGYLCGLHGHPVGWLPCVLLATVWASF
jgi:hypothetical protein